MTVRCYICIFIRSF